MDFDTSMQNACRLLSPLTHNESLASENRIWSWKKCLKREVVAIEKSHGSAEPTGNSSQKKYKVYCLVWESKPHLNSPYDQIAAAEPGKWQTDAPRVWTVKSCLMWDVTEATANSMCRCILNWTSVVTYEQYLRSTFLARFVTDTDY